MGATRAARPSIWRAKLVTPSERRSPAGSHRDRSVDRIRPSLANRDPAHALVLRLQTDTKMTHVPYKGDTPAIQDVLAGHASLLPLTRIENAPGSALRPSPPDVKRGYAEGADRKELRREMEKRARR